MSLRRDRVAVAVTAGLTGIAALLMLVRPAAAAIVPPVGLLTAADYSVLSGQSVTNTGATILRGSLGLHPGSSVTGFPPGVVLAPSVMHVGDAVALQAQSDLTEAYDDAAGRPLPTELTPADIGNQTLTPGVYSGEDKGPLGLTGTLTLDGENNADAVFIFQTDSTLITAPNSRVELINGALECNVFWQVGSSATLDVNSRFVGTILALTSITVNSNVVVHGRALARNGEVTLDGDFFTQPGCTSEGEATTTTSGGGGGVTTTTSGGGGGATTTTSGGGAGGGVTTTLGGGAGGGGVTTTLGAGGGGGATTTIGAGGGGATVTTGPGSNSTGGTTTTVAGQSPQTGSPDSSGGPGVPGVVGLPRTGAEPPSGRDFPWLAALVASILSATGVASVLRSRPTPSRHLS